MFKPSSLLLIAIDLPFHWDLENNSTTTISPCTARFLKPQNVTEHWTSIWVAVQDCRLAKPFHSQDLLCNSPYCKPYNSYDVCAKNLELVKFTEMMFREVLQSGVFKLISSLYLGLKDESDFFAKFFFFFLHLFTKSSLWGWM